MGRQLKRQDSEIEFQRYHPGCMWGLLHILDYHHIQSLKKWPPRRKHGRPKRAVCCTNPKTVSLDHFPEEVHEYLDAEAVPLLVESETSPPSKLSSHFEVKAPVSKEISARSPSRQTAPIHHLEPSDHCLATKSANWANPIIILHKSVDNSRDLLKQEQNLSRTKQLDRGISCPQFDYVDVLEIFKVNKKLFMGIQEDQDIKLTKQQTSRAKASLKKSGSFPLPASSNISSARPTTLEHKQKEVWYSPKGGKLTPGVQTPEIFLPRALEDSYEKSQVLKADTIEGAVVSQDRNFPPLAFSQGSHKHGWPQWHHSVTNRIKYIKKKIKHVLKESRKENIHTSRNAVHHRVPVGSKLFTEENDMPETLENTTEQDAMATPKNSHLTNGSENVSGTVVQTNIRRASSSNESMNRYARLFEPTISKESKWSHYQSKSLKLTNDDKASRSRNGLKSFRRRLSMSDLDSFCSFPNEVSRDAFSSEFPKGYDVNAESDGHYEFKSLSNPVDRQQFEPTNALGEARPQEEVTESVGNDQGTIKTVEVYDNKLQTEKWEEEPSHGQEICSNNSKEQELDTRLQDYSTAAVEFPVSESWGLNAEHINTRKSDCFATVEDMSYRASEGGFHNIANGECDESASMIAENHLLPSDSSRQDDSDFNYVRDVLEVAGFIDQDCLGKWQSLDQPLSSRLFKELEAYLHGQCSSGDTGFDCNHRLLFDLINEELLDIYESSLAYFPKPFSFTTRRFKPIPKGNHLVEEVWKRINMYQNSYTDEQSLDDIVGRDLEKRDGWMNLLFDVEDVALDLEDLIFDELLAEVICSSDK